jgi:hypothetical protein
MEDNRDGTAWKDYYIDEAWDIDWQEVRGYISFLSKLYALDKERTIRYIISNIER